MDLLKSFLFISVKLWKTSEITAKNVLFFFLLSFIAVMDQLENPLREHKNISQIGLIQLETGNI